LDALSRLSGPDEIRSKQLDEGIADTSVSVRSGWLSVPVRFEPGDYNGDCSQLENIFRSFRPKTDFVRKSQE
jgi:hypothetical protein